MLSIRPATVGDLTSIQSIYAHHVLHGRASFEVNPPSEAELRARFESIVGAGFPYLVAEQDDQVLGYAYVSAYRARHAYRFAVEDSIYVRDGLGGKGVGKRMLNALIEHCTAQGFRLMVAVIGDSQNAGSISLHARCGFRFSGVLPSVGYKHNEWIDSVLMTRALGDGDRSHPGEITPAQTLLEKV
jgi:phosphinothricin acetyltransferase